MISNDDVVRTLERIADLLESRGENVYKVRAYRQAEVPPTLIRLVELPGLGPRTPALDARRDRDGAACATVGSEAS